MPEEKKAGQKDPYKAIADMATIDYPIVKDQQRYILSLATGTLVFSLTFVEKVAPMPIGKWLIVTGWIFLLLSIFAGIGALYAFYGLITTMSGLKRMADDENISNIVFDEDQTYLQRSFMKRFVPDELVRAEMKKAGSAIEDAEIDSYKDALLKSKDFYETVKKRLLKPDDESVDMKKGAEMRRSFLRLSSSMQYLMRGHHPTKLINSMRKCMIQMAYLPKISLWTFYVGVLNDHDIWHNEFHRFECHWEKLSEISRGARIVSCW